MSLIRTIDELNAHTGLNTGIGILKVMPLIDLATEDVLMPLVGRETYSEVLEAYREESMTEQQAVLHALMAKVVGFVAVAHLPEINSVDFDAQGATRFEDGQRKTPFKYQIEQHKTTYMQIAFAAAERMLRHLESHADTFVAWATSEEAAHRREFVVNTAGEFDTYYYIKKNRLTFRNLKPLMRHAKQGMRGVIGDLAGEIHAQVKEGSVSVDYQYLLDTFLKEWFVLTVVLQALREHVVSIQEGQVVMIGFKSPSGTEYSAADTEQLEVKKKAIKKRLLDLTDRLVKHLQAQASESRYAAYFNSTLYPNADKAKTEKANSIYGG